MNAHAPTSPLSLLRIVSSAFVLAAALAAAPSVADATTIERIVSPGGIEAWLVHDSSVPLIAIDFAFRGGATQDPVDKPGVANLAASLARRRGRRHRVQ